jgi:hypothetical protein
VVGRFALSLSVEDVDDGRGGALLSRSRWPRPPPPPRRPDNKKDGDADEVMLGAGDGDDPRLGEKQNDECGSCWDERVSHSVEAATIMTDAGSHHGAHRHSAEAVRFAMVSPGSTCLATTLLLVEVDKDCDHMELIVWNRCMSTTELQMNFFQQDRSVVLTTYEKSSSHPYAEFPPRIQTSLPRSLARSPRSLARSPRSLARSPRLLARSLARSLARMKTLG